MRKRTNFYLLVAVIASVIGCGAPATEPESGEPAQATSDLGPATEAMLQEVAFQIPGRDMREQPPQIVAMRLYPTSDTGGPTARMEMKMTEELPPVLKFVWNDRVTSMRDDGSDGDRRAGDRVFTALVNVDLDAEARNAAALARALPTSDLTADLAQGGIDIPVHGQIAAPMPGVGAAATLRTALAAAASDNCGGGPCEVDPEKSLVIRDLPVVNSDRTSDPCLTPVSDTTKRAWNFGYLMSQMYPQGDPSSFALAWLNEWEQPRDSQGRARLVNNQTLRAVRFSPTSPVTLPGTIRSQWQAASQLGGRVRMNKAPFRLLAIVNRFDLRKNMMFGAGYAGELRFVYGVLDLFTGREESGACASMDIPGTGEGGDQARKVHTVILEYGVFRGDPSGVLDWAKKWHALSQLPWDGPGLSQYLSQLEAMTESVVRANAAPDRLNNSALLRIRSNETPNNDLWDLREFEVRTGSPFLKAVTVKQTPAGFVNASTNLKTWFDRNRTSLIARDFLDGRKQMTDSFPSNAGYLSPLTFLGARAVTSINNADNIIDGVRFRPLWTVPNMAFNSTNVEARHLLALGTCSGCHNSRETGTRFAHIQARTHAEPAQLSSFLTGVDLSTSEPAIIPDPIDPNRKRFFNDIDVRNVDLANFLLLGPTAQLSFQPSTRVH